MRALVIGLLLVTTSVVAENQYALVDSVTYKHDRKIFLSFEAVAKENTKSHVTLTGSMWYKKYDYFKNIDVTVTKEAQEAMKDKDKDKKIILGDISYRTHERVLHTEQSKIIRKMLVSQDNSTMIGLSDDPGPLVIPAIVAGSVVALCTAQVIYNMYECDRNKPRLTIGFGGGGFQCEAKCE